MQINSYIYKWQTNDNACQTCKALHNTTYTNEDAIPPKPHPNCKCIITQELNSLHELEQQKDSLEALKKQKSNDRQELQQMLLENGRIHTRQKLVDMLYEKVNELTNIEKSINEINKTIKNYNSLENTKDTNKNFIKPHTPKLETQTKEEDEEYFALLKSILENSIDSVLKSMVDRNYDKDGNLIYLELKDLPLSVRQHHHLLNSFNFLPIFAFEYLTMKQHNREDVDSNYHTSANALATQESYFSALGAKFLSWAREAYQNEDKEAREKDERANRIGQELGERMRKEGRKLTREQMYEELIKKYPEFEIKEAINRDKTIAAAGLQKYNREKYEEVMKRKKMKKKSSNK